MQKLVLPALIVACLPAAFPQSQAVPKSQAVSPSHKMVQGPHRMEITLERFELGMWHAIDPNLVLNEGDHIRFRYHTNFDGYLYVTNQASSGTYQQLFPLKETGEDNRIISGKDYQVPSTSGDFRVAGPAGYEVVYFLVTPGKVSAEAPRMNPVPPDFKVTPPTLIPRCDDTVLRARGDCIDHTAGPSLVPRGAELPQSLAQASDQGRRDLMFMRQNDKAVISSPVPLTGPVIYEFRLAHK